jgi:hypothetical protein
MVYAGLTICFLMDIINSSLNQGLDLNTQEWAGITPAFPQILIQTSRRVNQGI